MITPKVDDVLTVDSNRDPHSGEEECQLPCSNFNRGW